MRAERRPASNCSPCRAALSLVEIMVSMVVLSSTAVLFSAVWSTTGSQVEAVRSRRAATALLAQQAELIRRKVDSGDPTPWQGPTGALDRLRLPPFQPWRLKLDTPTGRYRVIGEPRPDLAEATGTCVIPQGAPLTIPRTDAWYLLNETNIGSSTEPLGTRRERLATVRLHGMDVVIHAAALEVLDATDVVRPRALPAEPRDVAIWQISVLEGGRRIASTQIITWFPIHRLPGEPP